MDYALNIPSNQVYEAAEILASAGIYFRIESGAVVVDGQDEYEAESILLDAGIDVLVW